MMRGPTYDDGYITRKMSQIPGGPTFSSPGVSSYGRPPATGYLQDSYTSPYSSYSAGSSLVPDLTEERRSMSPAPGSGSSYRPSAATQLILNRVALGRSALPPGPPSVYGRGYPPMGPPPPPRYVPRMHPAYYDYDYGYGGYYYAPPPPPPRISRYDSYLDDTDLIDSPYLPRYRPRVVDVDDADYRDKTTVPHATTTTPRTTSYTSPYSPGMLQDHVDKMRIRLKSLAYSLDPTGPVPEIILPERSKKPVTSTALATTTTDDNKKYSSALEFNELPKIATRRQRYYPEDDHMKDNLRIKCLSHYKTTRTQAEKEKEKLILKDRLSNRIHQFFNSTLNAEQFDKYLKSYRQPGAKSSKSQLRQLIPDSSRVSKYSGTSTSKWEEPDTVFGGPSDRKPYSKVETGSSFFSTYGITNRKKDYVAEKVRDYYYFGDDKTKAITDGTTDETSEEKKERRKKKKSKEREVVAETSPTEVTSSAAPEVEAVSATGEIDGVALDEIDDEKERKKLEKKKRKAEREAAAKAAMEAELAALAAAEAELARLEAESSKTEASAEGAKDAAPAEVKSESAAEKCESSGKAVSEGVCVTPDPAPPIPNQAPSQVPLQVPEEPQVPEPPQEPQPQPQPTPDDLIIDQPPPLKESQLEQSQVEPQVEEPKVELPLEESKVEIAMEEPNVDTPELEPEVEAPVEEPKAEPPMEEPQMEEPKVEEPPVPHPVEEPTVEPPKEEPEGAAEIPTVEEVAVEPPAEVASVGEPQVEAQGDEAAVVEEESTGWTPRAPRRTALDDDDAGWLDDWAGEAQQQGSSPLGTAADVSQDPEAVVAAAAAEEGDAVADAADATPPATTHHIEDDLLPQSPPPPEQSPDEIPPATIVADDPAPEPAVVVVDDAVPAPVAAADEADNVPVSIPTTRSEEELEE